MLRLQGKVAIITGAGSGIGRETALLFAGEGAKVVVSDYVPEVGEETVRQIKESGGESIFIKADVSRADDAERMVRETVAEYGRLDILHNNAGILGKVALTGDTSEADWDKVISVNLKGVFLCSKYAVREMVKGGKGSIVSTASAMGLVGLPGNTAYSAAKGGVIQFTKTMALEYASSNIRVNCICAGWIDTPMNESLGERVTGWTVKETPMGRWGRPEEVAQAALYLASDESSFVTGTALVVDGGWVAK
jgi:NAD(P)-dependent dehydrogenase (short-subunit alcohol dehydrogenase family)